MSITVQQASVKTATVTIKALVVSGKQVTLAVFRQLPQQRLVARDGTLLGVPWGVVNYWPERDSAHGRLHVVWQDGDELRRDKVDSLFPPHERLPPDWQDECLRYLLTAAHHGATALPHTFGGSHALFGYPFGLLGHAKWEVVDALEGLALEESGPAGPWQVNMRSAWRERVTRALLELEYPWVSSADQLRGTAEVEEDLRTAAALQRASEARYRESYATLAQLDQLFIAV